MNDELIIFEDDPDFWASPKKIETTPTPKKKIEYKPIPPKRNSLGLTPDEMDTVIALFVSGLFTIFIVGILIGYMEWYFKQ